MAQSVPQRKVVDQGPWWLLAIAVLASFAVTVMSINAVVASPTLTNQFAVAAGILLTIWFALGTSFSAVHRPVPSTGSFLILLFIMMLLAGYVVSTGQFLAIIPGLIALIGLIVNVRKL